MPFVFDNSYAKLPDHFYSRVSPTPVLRPALFALNESLGESLGLDLTELRSSETLEVFAGNRLPQGACSIAVAYAGHQFGGFVPQLGDGRALLLGEVITTDQKRLDVVLKGSGRTPYSRGGDGRAALGPVLREFLVSEAMAALGVPTTRALAAVTTGEFVARETRLPGAVLTRVASSHLRVGTFQFFAARGDQDALRLLTDYALLRHYPEADKRDGAALALLSSVIAAQARLVAKWQALGFVHGVMNTDNTSIAGETIDYGPCAFLDTFVPNRKFSSIDHASRYAYEKQPHIAHWNLTRLAEALLPLVDEDEARAIQKVSDPLDRFAEQYNQAFASELRRKLGLISEQPRDIALAQSLLELMAEDGVDFTLCFRALTDATSQASDGNFLGLFQQSQKAQDWLDSWRQRITVEPGGQASARAVMQQSNPAFIPRNHHVEEAIARATRGDYAHFENFHRVLGRPYESQPGEEPWAQPPGDEQWNYRTFCGT